jgi:hypothetical protein
MPTGWPGRRMTALLLVAMLLLLAEAAAGAVGSPAKASPRSPVLGSDFRVSGPDGVSDEWTPALAYNPEANEYLVVWSDFRNSPTWHWDIYGRRVSAAGVPLGSDFRISGTGATADEQEPAVAYDPDADIYLVVWTDGRDRATRSSDIYGRRVSAAGVPTGSELRVNGGTGLDGQEHPAVGYSPAAGTFLVVWSDGRDHETRGADIRGRLVLPTGAMAGPDFRISGRNATADERDPSLAYNATADEYLVVWTDERNFGGPLAWDIYARRVGSGGSRIGNDSRICGPGMNQSPAVAYNTAADQYLVVWHDGRNIPTRSSDTYGRRVGADGSGIGASIRMSGPGGTAAESGQAVASESDGYLVIWSDGRNSTISGYDIYGRKVAFDGTRVGGDFRITGTGGTADDYSPAAAYSTTAVQYLVVWSDGRNMATSSEDTYGRRVAG